MAYSPFRLLLPSHWPKPGSGKAATAPTTAPGPRRNDSLLFTFTNNSGAIVLQPLVEDLLGDCTDAVELRCMATGFKGENLKLALPLWRS